IIAMLCTCEGAGIADVPSKELATQGAVEGRINRIGIGRQRQPCSGNLRLGAGAANSEKDQYGAVQPDDVVVSKTANKHADFRFCNRVYLVHHQPRGGAQAIAFVGFYRQPKERSILSVGSKGTHSKRVRHVKAIILNDHDGTRLARVVLTASNGPYLTAAHYLPQSETASMKSWSSLA